MRYECICCGHKFDKPDYFKEGSRELGYAEIEGCPVCGGAFIENTRNCADCVWMAEDGCTSWECEYVSRMELRKLIKMGRVNLAELAKEVNHDNH